MNTKTNHRFGIYLPLALLLSTVACTLRTVAAFLGVDAFGYFKAAKLSSVSAWILISAILIMLTYPIAYAKRPCVLVRHTTPLTFIPSLLSGLAVILFVGEIGKGLYSSLLILDRVILLALFVLGIFSAVFFFSLAVVESGISDKKANYGMVLVLLLGVYAASLYLNNDIPRNAHTELSEEMTLIALSLFFLYEIRISLDKQKQNLYVTFGFIAAMLGAYTAIPSFIFYIASGTLLVSSLSVLLLILALLIFTIARLYLFNITPKNEASAIVRSLSDAARERAQAVEELEALYAPAPIPDEENEGERTDVSAEIEAQTNAEQQQDEAEQQSTAEDELDVEENDACATSDATSQAEESDTPICDEEVTPHMPDTEEQFVSEQSALPSQDTEATEFILSTIEEYTPESAPENIAADNAEAIPESIEADVEEPAPQNTEASISQAEPEPVVADETGSAPEGIDIAPTNEEKTAEREAIDGEKGKENEENSGH